MLEQHSPCYRRWILLEYPVRISEHLLTDHVKFCSNNISSSLLGLFRWKTGANALSQKHRPNDLVFWKRWTTQRWVWTSERPTAYTRAFCLFRLYCNLKIFSSENKIVELACLPTLSRATFIAWGVCVDRLLLTFSALPEPRNLLMIRYICGLCLRNELLSRHIRCPNRADSFVQWRIIWKYETYWLAHPVRDRETSTKRKCIFQTIAFLQAIKYYR